jgi:DNA invertase Pin-like site-specific DNA recombinase
MTTTTTAPTTVPALILHRTTKHDLAVHAELEKTYPQLYPPSQGGIATCGFDPGVELVATERDDVYAVRLFGYKSAAAARKRLDTVEAALSAAGYPCHRGESAPKRLDDESIEAALSAAYPDYGVAEPVLFVTMGGRSMTTTTTTDATTPADAPAITGQLLGYARVSTGHQHLDAQTDALTAAGVDPARIYSDKLTGTSTKEQRPGIKLLLDHAARPGDTIVVVGIDRLGRNAAEVMLTIRDLGERGIVLRSLREGIDTFNATGRMVAGVLASLAELELELGRERRAAARASRKSRGLSIGRPAKLDAKQIALAERMRTSGEPVSVIAEALKVSAPTVYRVLAEKE